MWVRLCLNSHPYLTNGVPVLSFRIYCEEHTHTPEVQTRVDEERKAQSLLFIRGDDKFKAGAAVGEGRGVEESMPAMEPQS